MSKESTTKQNTAMNPHPSVVSLAVVIPLFLAVFALSSAEARPPPHAWPFDFDPELAEDPDSIREKLADLGDNLPGLPAESMAELKAGPIDLWLFSDIAEVFLRAKDAGPPTPAPMPTPTRCAHHASFVFPSMLRTPASPACAAVEDELKTAFGEAPECLDIEFPERFVRALPPADVTLNVVSSIEGLIGLIGEALTHFDMPEGLVPPWFMPTARDIIAKLRAERLLAAAETRRAQYAAALAAAGANAGCFDASALARFQQDASTLERELSQAASDLERLVADGLAQAERDRQRVLAAGRDRRVLPYPSLTDRERELLAAYLGGFTWRMRGRGLVEGPTGTQSKRLYFTLRPFNAIGELVGGEDGDSAGVGLALGLLRGWGDLTDMGHTPGENDEFSDLVDLTDRGLYQISYTEPDLRDQHYDTKAFIAGGLQMGPCYDYPWLFATLYIGLELADPYVIFIDGPGASGEFCAGAALGLGLAKTMLEGTCETGACDCLSDCGDAGPSDGGTTGDQDGGSTDLGADSGASDAAEATDAAVGDTAGDALGDAHDDASLGASEDAGVADGSNPTGTSDAARDDNPGNSSGGCQNTGPSETSVWVVFAALLWLACGLGRRGRRWPPLARVWAMAGRMAGRVRPPGRT
ncbi:MAG: hypothetical protein IPK13_13925 [Deltaproteobacteria bacterium]|nr:hypothetical protein [Deltaproteobacteria bacterium]